MAILLSKSEKDLAKQKFYKFKARELHLKDKSLSVKEAEELAKTKFKTIPERYYRERMKENQGLLMIYLFDSRYAFNELGIVKDEHKHLKEQFKNYVNEHNIDTSIPLVGYAIEFPPIENDPGGTYMQGDYDLDIDEEMEEVTNSEEQDELGGIDDGKDI